MNIKKYFDSRKFKYGSVAVIMTVAFIAVILLANLMITVLGNKYSLYADMTTREFYTVSQASVQQLSQIKTPVEIVFFQKSDDIADPSQSATALGYVKYLAEEYGKKFDFVTVKYIDMLKHPADANAYKSGSDTIRTDSVVINCPSTGRKKTVQIKGFFTFNSNNELYGFNGEKRITSCILQVVNQNKPKVLFSTGHEEYLSNSFGTLFQDEGYEVGVIDISTAEIPYDTDLLVINMPKRDFSGIEAEQNGGTNEIERIKNYIQNDYGDVILVLSASYPDLPELKELLEDNFGITYVAQTVLTDTASNTVQNDGAYIIAQPCGTEESFEYQMHKSVTEKGIKIVAPYSVQLKIVGSVDKYVMPILSTSATSKVMSIDGKTTVEAPNTPIVALSSKISYDDDDNEKRGNLLVAGSMLMFEDNCTGNSSYGNADFLYGILKTLGNKSVSVDIAAKPFDDNYLDITKGQANKLSFAVIAILPIIILVAGVAVWYVRKRK